MDFKLLMAKASANQLVAEKQLERKKQRQDDVVAEMVKFKLEEKKAAEKRKDARMAAVQKQLQKPSVSKAPTTIRSQTSSKAELSREQKTTQAKDTRSQQPVARTSKCSSSQPATDTSKPRKSKPPKGPSERLPKSQSSPLTQPKNGISLPTAHKPASSRKSQVAPLSFQELLVIAQKKASESSKGPSKEDLTTSGATSTAIASPKEPITGRKRKAENANGTDSAPRRKSKSPLATIRRPTNSSIPVDDPGSRGSPRPRGDKSDGPKPSAQPRVAFRAHHTIPQRETPKDPPVVPPSQKNPYLNSVQAIDFYGTTNFSKLSQNGRPKFATEAKPKYASSWAGEVAEVLERRKQHGGSQDMGEEEDEEEDMLDFVEEEGDDDFIDDSEACDYSSAIREIFGYDKRKFAGERHNDLAMESSYAQQQFEESRSAHIGRLEDEEDIKREKIELAKKKQKREGGLPPEPVQSKLQFT